MNRTLELLFLVGAASCSGETLGVTTGGPDTDTDGPDLAGEWPDLVGPCALDPEEPGRLVITTTDFGTGAVSVLDLATATLQPDVALASTDAIPFATGGRVFIVNRFQHDYVDVLDPGDGWASLGEHPVAAAGVASANPTSLALGPDGLAHVALFGAPAVVVVDPARPPDQSEVGRISLAPFDDGDGNPEATNIVACGDVAFVTLERLDAELGLEPRDGDRVVAVDLVSRAPYGHQLPVLGEFIKQLRRDPGDPDRHTILALTTGIERIDLETRDVSWAVSDEVFRAAGLDHRWHPQAFDVDGDGVWAYLAAYDPDFAQIRLYRVALEGPDQSLEEIAAGFDSVERTLEVVGDRLWYGSTASGEPGLWSIDLSVDPPTVLDGPLSTGLPPYSVTVMP